MKRKLHYCIGIVFTFVFVILAIAFSPIFIVLSVIFLPVTAFFVDAGLFPDSDEFERKINWRAGFISFHLTLLLLLGIFMSEYMKLRENPSPVFYLMLIFPVVLYFLVVLFQGVFGVKAGRRILYVFGGIWILFALLSEGFTVGGLMQSLFGAGFLLVAGVSYVSVPISAFLSFCYALFLTLFVVINSKTPSNAVIIFSTMCLPLLFSGALFLKREEGGE